MKRIIFLTFSISLLIVSCKNDSLEGGITEDEITLTDSLPEGKWNGEYVKIVDEDEKPTIKKKSLGSEFYSMGTVQIVIDNDSLDFRTFEKKKNALTFTKNKVTAFIQNAYEDRIKIQFNKSGIMDQFKGTYKIDKNNKLNQSVSMEMTTTINGKEEKVHLVEGKVELLDFHPRLANLSFKIVDGIVETDEGNQHSFSGSFNMRFEEAIMGMD